MRVTKEQVERLAKAKAEYDDAEDSIRGYRPRRVHLEPVESLARLRELAKAAGARVEVDESTGYVTHRFDVLGVEFYHVVDKPKGGDA